MPQPGKELYDDPEGDVELERREAVGHLRSKGVPVEDNISWDDLLRAFEIAAQKRGEEIYRGDGGYYDELLRWHEVAFAPKKEKEPKIAV